MAKRGRKPVPTPILAARGSWRAKQRPDFKVQPEPSAEPPQCPEWLTGEGRRRWDEVVPKLVAIGLVSRADEFTLSRYCQIWAWWLDCERFIAEHGIAGEQRDKDGKLRIMEFPQSRRAKALGDQLLAIEREYGMTPVARLSLPSHKETPRDAKLERYFSQPVTALAARYGQPPMKLVE